MNRSLFRLGLCVALALALCAPRAYAQGSSTSTISGRVVDSSGGVLPGATVSAKHVGTNTQSTTVTNSEGLFSLPSLQAGTYEVTVSLEGFKTTVVKDVVITAVQGADVQAKLELGGVTETVTVASTSEIIQTQSTQISSTINTNQITKLPLTTRSAMDFVNFLPGVSTPGGNRQATINGLPQSVINITLDGINIQDNTNRSTDGFFAIVSPRLDAIEEVSVTTAGQSAEAGQGAVQIKFTTRSGTNQFSGSGFHYYRADELNANTWFNNRSGTEKAELLQNQFGGRLGGPLVVPGLLGRGKAFFFGAYEELRQPSEATRTRNFMTSAARNGTLTYGASGATLNVLNFAAARGLLASVDPTVAKLLQDIESAATGAGNAERLDANVNQVRFNIPVESKRIYPTGRIDYNINDNHRVTSAVNYNRFTDYPDTLNTKEPSFPGFPVAAGQTSIRLAWSNSLRSTLGRNLVNEFRVGYSGAPLKFYDELNVGMYAGEIANTQGFHINMPGLTSSLAGAAASGPNPQSRDANDLAFDNNLTWLKGSHSITAGASLSRYKVWLKNATLVPTISFGILSTDPANDVFTAANLQAATGVLPTNAELTAARNLYALLTGRVTQIAGNARLDASGRYNYVGEGIQRAKMDEYGFFVQDSWRLKPNFTVNGGVRWSLQMPFTSDADSYSITTMEDVCNVSGIDPSTGYCNLFQPGHMPGTVTESQFYQMTKGTKAYGTDWNNFAPNVGIAWTPERRGGLLGALMSDEFVIRAGWSRAYSREGMGRFTGDIGANPGGLITVTRSEANGNIIPAGASAPLLFRNPGQLGAPQFPERPTYPLTDLVTQDIVLHDPNLEVAFADSWSAGFQRKITTNLAFELRYVGTRSDNALATRNWNEINIVENGFLEEFKKAQANLQANIAAGRGNTFAYTGAPGTVPLPIFLAHYNGVPTANAGNAALYTGSPWTTQANLNALAARNPDPYAFASTGGTNGLLGNAAFRARALAAGLPANFWVANPNKIGGAYVVVNSHKTRYHSLQAELRRRLANGLQFNTSYVFGEANATSFYSHRLPLVWLRDTGTPGDLTHQFKLNMVYDLPLGQGRRFLSGAGPVLNRLVQGWQVGINSRVQSGRLFDLGNVRLVGWTAEDVQDAFKLRFNHDNKQIFMWPEDVIENTRRAWAVSPTSPTGYSGQAPTGRYFAPANGPDCIEVIEGSGECGGTRSLVVHGPMFSETDLRISKATAIKGRVNFEVAAEFLNVFNQSNFLPDATVSSTTLTDYLVTGLYGTNTSRVIQLVSRINW